MCRMKCKSKGVKILLVWSRSLIKVLSVLLGQILSKVLYVTKIPLNCHINYQGFLFPSLWITQGDIFMTMEAFSVCSSCLISFQMKSFSQKRAYGFYCSVDLCSLPATAAVLQVSVYPSPDCTFF